MLDQVSTSTDIDVPSALADIEAGTMKDVSLDAPTTKTGIDVPSEIQVTFDGG
jgi:hypothetical protein